MRLRYLFIITFCLIALFPVALFWTWPYSKALESELDDVKERHLVIAKNLSGSFERYYNDVTGVFSIIDNEIIKKEEFKTLLKSYGFNTLMTISKDGIVDDCLFYSIKQCPKKIDTDNLNLVNNTLEKNESKISTVTVDKKINNEPILLVVKNYDNNILLGYLSTKYIINMGKKVAFGKKGHAAVVDQKGNVLAHPLDSWIAERKNILKVSAVKKMLSSQTGVEKFYSPALKGDMIAGYTFVPNANWGVMVPQPIEELELKAKEIDKTAIIVMFVGLILALLITIPISIILIKPLERLSKIIKSIKDGSSLPSLEFELSKGIPLEIRELKKSFITMMKNIEENKKTISTLAYFDYNTGLPNRNYFYKFSKRVLDEMLKSNEKGALVFIDFDGFKSVNDTYGHRLGDELLSLFGERIIKYFCLAEENNNLLSLDMEFLPEVIPARLGGDEFVLLFKNINNEAELKSEIEKLFKEIFTSYDLYGGVNLKLTGSAGIALFPQDGKEYNLLLKSADTAMYDAKASGKNTIKFFKKKA